MDDLVQCKFIEKRGKFRVTLLQAGYRGGGYFPGMSAFHRRFHTAFAHSIFLIRHRSAPFIGSPLGRDLDCQMGKPAVRGSAVPVLYLRRDVHDIPRMKLLRFLSPLLIISPGPRSPRGSARLCGGYASCSGIPAQRSHCPLPALRRKHVKVTLSFKIRCKCFILFPNREYA